MSTPQAPPPLPPGPPGSGPPVSAVQRLTEWKSTGLAVLVLGGVVVNVLAGNHPTWHWTADATAVMGALGLLWSRM